MSKKFDYEKLVIATHNKGKLREIKELLAPYKVDVLSACELDLDEPEETGKTFEENALIKARYVCEKTNLPALADDSGLCVDALDGQPGIYSARWAGENKDFNIAMDKIIKLLENKEDKNAHFACALAICFPDNTHECFVGKVFGEITDKQYGKKGFGYDPIFKPKGYDVTFGQFEEEKKQKISHRANAFNLLIKNCF